MAHYKCIFTAAVHTKAVWICSFAVPVSLDLLSTWLMAGPGPPDADAEIEGNEHTLDPLVSFRLDTMYNAKLHCDSLSGRATQHDVRD